MQITRSLIILLIISIFAVSCEETSEKKQKEFETLFETSGGTQTPEYNDVIDFYKSLANEHTTVSLQTMGSTDSGFPLHMVVYNPEGDFNFNNIRDKNKRILLINNGIHPGESDGIDATMMLIRDYAQGIVKPPKNTIIVAIPVYNIGGALNRNKHTRANQNGPVEYGFRGNAKNYDLNRDFIKMDSKNAKSFAEIFHLVQPDVFIDNHVSNGADYQYTLTHLFTQHDKLRGSLGNYLHKEFMPALVDSLSQKNLPITPYVNVFNQTPEVGFEQFLDYPRYSTGYTTLWNTLGLMVETHMLKPYKERVEGTYELMKSLVNITDKEYKHIGKLRNMAFEEVESTSYLTLDWKVDSTKYTSFSFKGFEADTLLSEVTGFKRLKYNETRPYERNVKYYNYFQTKTSTKVPKAYIIPQAWHKVIDNLKANKVNLRVMEEDSMAYANYYRIKSFETVNSPFEGHYMHYNTQTTSFQDSILIRKGDIIVQTNQYAKRYLVQTLEPRAPDSFFNWNFFDSVLQQKEHFSPYVFEDVALEILQSNAKLKAEFENKKNNEPEFANNWYAQLDWIYKNTDYYEKAHLRYPIYFISE